MGDYLPIHQPGSNVTFVATTDITGGQVVEITGDDSVGVAAAASTKVIGQASRNVKAGQRLNIVLAGQTIQEATASGAIVAGDHVKSAATGKITKFTVGTDPEPARLGLCIRGAADGQPARYLTA